MNKARLYLRTDSQVELQLTNSQFSGNADGWTLSTDWNYYDGRVYAVAGNETSISQSLTPTIGTEYEITINYSCNATGELTVLLGGVQQVINEGGIQTFTITPTSATGLAITKNSSYAGYIEYVTIIEKNSLNKTYEEIELTDDEIIQLTFTRENILSIATKNSTYSQSFQIAGTANNNKIFEQLFNIDIYETNKKLNKKIRCLLYWSDFQIVDGLFYLNSVEYVEETKQIVYECEINSNIKTLAEDLGNHYLVNNEDPLNDITFNEYNHEYTRSNISSSWLTGNGSGYIYPLINYNNLEGTRFRVEDFMPAVYHKEILDKIFSGINKSYTSTFLNSDDFKSMISPCVNTNLTPANELSNRECFVGMTTNRGENLSEDYWVEGGATNRLEREVPLDNDTSVPFYDNGDNFNTGLFKYIVPNQGLYKISSKLKFKLQFYTVSTNFGIYTLQGVNGLPAYAKFSLQIFKNSNLLSSKDIKINLSTSSFASGAGSGQVSFAFITDMQEIVCSTLYAEELNAGDLISARIVADHRSSATGNKLITSSGSEAAFRLRMNVIMYNLDNIDTSLRATTLEVKALQAPSAYPGDTINLDSVLPKKKKKIDYVSDLFKTFNLVIDEDKDNFDNYIIDTYENYYSSGSTKDWGQKLDRSQGLIIERIPTLINKNFRISYSLDSDYYNTKYNKTWKNIYGEREILNDDLTNEEEFVQVGFASTPSVVIPESGFITSGMYNLDDSGNLIIEEMEMRILYRKDVSFYSPSWNNNSIAREIGSPRITITDGNDTYVNVGKFVTATHWDDPYSATTDLNFGICNQYFHRTNATWGNTYNRFWRKKIEQYISEDSRMVTGYFKLNEEDMFNFKFNDQITIDGQVFIVQEISNWNPDSLTQVQLLKLIEPNIPVGEEPRRLDVISDLEYKDSALDTPFPDTPPNNGGGGFGRLNPRTLPNLIGISQRQFEYEPYQTGGTGTYSGTSAIQENIIDSNARGFINGENNNISGTYINVTGDENVLDTVKTAIVAGNNNELTNTENSTIIGNDNDVEGTQKTTVIGNNITATKSNALYLGGENIFVNRIPTPIIHVITPGGDVLNPFNRFSQVHVINGGKDCVRPLLPSANNIFVIDTTSNPFYNFKS